jgi:hypothetical protein
MIEQILTVVSWVGVPVSITGAWMVAHKNPRGFYFFLVADVLFIGIQLYTKIWSQATVLVIYFAISAIGVWNARKELF